MKKVFFLLLLFVISITNSQEKLINVALKKSKVFKERSTSTIKTTFKDDLSNLYILRELDSKKSFLFDVFDKDFKRLNTYEHELKKRHKVAGAFLKENTFGFIEYFRNKKEEKVEAFLYTSQKETLSFSKKKIFEVQSDSYPSFFEYLFSNSKIDKNFAGNLSFSESGKYHVFNIDSYDKKNESHKILVFDENFIKLWEKEFSLPYKDKNFRLENIIVSDNGEIFILGKVDDRKRKKKKKGGKYHYELFKITKEKTNSIKLSVDEHFVSTLEMNITPNGKIGCFGFYSNKNDFRFKGVNSFIINKENLVVEKTNFSPFTEQFIIDKYGKKKNKELRNIKLKKVSHTENGNIIITAEEFYITSTYVHNQFGGYTRIFYNFDDIIVLKVNKEGKLIWARNINKAQTSNSFSHPLMSFGTANFKNKEYLVLNAHKKMGELSGGRVKFRESFLWKATKRNTNLYIGMFDKNGNFFYQSILFNKDEETVFNCRYLEQISENELILYGQRKKKRQLLKITIN